MSTKLQRQREMEAKYDGHIPDEARDYIEAGEDSKPGESDLVRHLGHAIAWARDRHTQAVKHIDPHNKKYFREEAHAAVDVAKEIRAQLMQLRHAGAEHLRQRAVDEANSRTLSVIGDLIGKVA